MCVCVHTFRFIYHHEPVCVLVCPGCVCVCVTQGVPVSACDPKHGAGCVRDPQVARVCVPGSEHAVCL